MGIAIFGVALSIFAPAHSYLACVPGTECIFGYKSIFGRPQAGQTQQMSSDIAKKGRPRAANAHVQLVDPF